MFRVQSLAVLLGLLLCMLPSRPTIAQQFGDVVYEAARNKIGLIRYCRKNGLLDPAVADEVVATVETGLQKLLPVGAFGGEQGDRAQQAGEDGFWEAGRRRDIDSVAKLFRTTPAALCQEWADETLRAQPPRLYREVKTITVAAPPRPIQTLPQAGLDDEEPVPDYGLPPLATAVAGDAPSAPFPPLPEKAPFVSALAEPASSRQPLPAGGQLASTDRTLRRSTLPPSWGQGAPLSEREPAEPDEPLPPDEIASEAEPVHHSDDDPPPRWERWSFKRPGKSQRCFMPGCTWRATAPEKRSSGY
jgi:hypothetical protein